MGPDTAAEVLGLLEEFRSSRGLRDRAGLIRRGVEVIGRLSGDEKRQLAVDVASYVAPELVPRIREHTGSDLTQDQVLTVVDLLRRLEPGDLDALEAQLRDREGRRELLTEVGRDVAEAAAVSAGLEELVEDADQVDPDADEVEVPDEPDAADVTLLSEALEVEPPPPPPAYEPRLPELATWRPTPLADDLFRFDAPPASPARGSATRQPAEPPEPPEPAVPHERSWFSGNDLGIASVEPAPTTLAERLLALERPGHRLHAFGDALDEVRGMPVAEQVGVLRALQDGWVRRRAIERLIRADGLAVADVPRVAATLERALDRAWVVATALEEGLTTLDRLGDLEALVGPRGAQRLRRRYTPDDELVG